jgi:hypothetical protein
MCTVKDIYIKNGLHLHIIILYFGRGTPQDTCGTLYAPA